MVILRAFLALAAGFATTIFLAVVSTILFKRLAPQWAGDADKSAPGYFFAHLGGTFIAGAAGGYVTAWLAATNPMGHVQALGIAVLVLAALSALQERSRQPLWQHLALVALTPAGVVAGGIIYLLVLGIL